MEMDVQDKESHYQNHQKNNLAIALVSESQEQVVASGNVGFVKDKTKTGMNSLILVSVVAVIAATQGCQNVELVSRDRWGARVSKGNESMKLPVPHLFLHHTAMSECNDFNSCCRMMRSIQNYHMDNNGWDDIGYNFLIGGDGRVYIGRGWNRVGAHTYGYNRDGIAFSLMGDFTNKEPSETMLNTTKYMIECAKKESYVTSDYQLHGHRDAGCTECPGTSFYNLIKTWPNFVGGPLPKYNCR